VSQYEVNKSTYNNTLGHEFVLTLVFNVNRSG
jgi:transcriptional regulator with XRE-family HTH domain